MVIQGGVGSFSQHLWAWDVGRAAVGSFHRHFPLEPSQYDSFTPRFKTREDEKMFPVMQRLRDLLPERANEIMQHWKKEIEAGRNQWAASNKGKLQNW